MTSIVTSNTENLDSFSPEISHQHQLLEEETKVGLS